MEFAGQPLEEENRALKHKEYEFVFVDLWGLVSLIFSRATTNVLFFRWYTFKADFYSISNLINPICEPLLSCIMFSLFYFIIFFPPRHSMNHQPTYSGPGNVIILPRCVFKAFIYLNLNKVSDILVSQYAYEPCWTHHCEGTPSIVLCMNVALSSFLQYSLCLQKSWKTKLVILAANVRKAKFHIDCWGVEAVEHNNNQPRKKLHMGVCAHVKVWLGRVGCRKRSQSFWLTSAGTPNQGLAHSSVSA